MKSLKFIIIVFLFSIIQTNLNAQSNKIQAIWQLITEGKYEQALNTTNEQLKYDTANYQLYQAKGKILEQLFRYDEGIGALETANRLQADDVSVLSTLAGMYTTLGRPKKAVEIYDRLMELEPNVVRWRMNCAMALQAAGLTNYAISEYHWLRILDSTNWLVYKNLGDCFIRQDNLKVGAQCYKEAMARNPQNLVLSGQLAGMYVKLDRLKSAINVAKQALTYDSTFREGLRWLGIAYYTASYRDSSLHIFEQLWKLGDSSAMVNRYLGMLYYQNAGKKGPLQLDEVYAKSEKHLRKALLADPENIDVLFTLGSVCGYNNKPAEGLTVLSALDTVLNKYEIMKAYTEAEKGLLFRQSKLYDKAIQCYRKAMQLFPDKDIYLYDTAVTYDYAGNKKQAIDWYKRFMQKRDSNWEKRVITPEASHENVALGRIRTLTDELFMEEK
ncbi:MAG: hypothetical protein LBL90_10610 [Prevotellaceae bacterium]|jgi:tetratricopeptide (TPR) repeat protein|nr:hypothetical protein [Prevotellaceae bacterium]